MTRECHVKLNGANSAYAVLSTYSIKGASWICSRLDLAPEEKYRRIVEPWLYCSEVATITGVRCMYAGIFQLYLIPVNRVTHKV